MSKTRIIKEPEKMYKVLDGLRSPITESAIEYEPGKKYTCKDFDPDPDNVCSNGFYATELDGLPFAWRTFRNVYEVEVWGMAVEIDKYKRRYEHIRVIKELGTPVVADRAREIERDLGYCLSEVIQPIDPTQINPPEIDAGHLHLLDEWKLILSEVGLTLWKTIRHPVQTSINQVEMAAVAASVWKSIMHSAVPVRRLVCDYGEEGWAGRCLYSYIGSLFPGVETWVGMDHEKGEYPFQPAADLWREGIIPSHDGDVWKLHGGENMEILWEEYNE